MLGDEAVAALDQSGLISRRPKATDAVGEPLPAAALVLPTERLPAMRFKPHALHPGRVPQRPREEPQQEGVRSGVDAYLDEDFGGHGGAKCAPRVRDRLSAYQGSEERHTARAASLVDVHDAITHADVAEAQVARSWVACRRSARCHDQRTEDTMRRKFALIVGRVVDRRGWRVRLARRIVVRDGHDDAHGDRARGQVHGCRPGQAGVQPRRPVGVSQQDLRRDRHDHHRFRSGGLHRGQHQAHSWECVG